MKAAIDRLSAALCAQLPCRRRLLGDDEVPEQHAARLGLNRVRVDRHEMIAEEAFLFVIEQIGLQHLGAARTLPRTTRAPIRESGTGACPARSDRLGGRWCLLCSSRPPGPSMMVSIRVDQRGVPAIAKPLVGRGRAPRRRLAARARGRISGASMQAAEVLVLAAVVAALFWLLGPLRRRLEGWLARRLRPSAVSRRARVVVLGQRRDGGFAREDGHER